MGRCQLSAYKNVNLLRMPYRQSHNQTTLVRFHNILPNELNMSNPTIQPNYKTTSFISGHPNFFTSTLQNNKRTENFNCEITVTIESEFNKNNGVANKEVVVILDDDEFDLKETSL